MRLTLGPIETHAQFREQPAERPAHGRLGKLAARQARVHRRQSVGAIGDTLGSGPIDVSVAI